jgi:hypothetical protein
VLPRVTAIVPNPIPLLLPDAAYLRDHQFNGRPVLPAVETMELLAAVVAVRSPHIDVRQIQEAHFDKFLPLDTADEIELWCEWEAGKDESVVAQLKSKRRGKRGIARTLTHARMIFGSVAEASNTPDRVAATCSPAAIKPPSPERLYAELVPFGPSYRNIRAITGFDVRGIRAEIGAPALPQVEGCPCLGSPFVLDAAFHAACVWGQRHAGIVAFPVGLGRRKILRPCEAGGRYEALVSVREKDPTLLVLDITIEANGVIHEILEAVRMRDVSGGRLKPPSWIVAGVDNGAEV